MPAPSHVLVVRLSSLGDLVNVGLAIAGLRRAWPEARFDWVTQPEYLSLAGAAEGVDRVIPFPRRAFFRRAPSLWRTLRERHYDLALDFHGLLKSGLVIGMARADRKIGPSFQREGARVFYREVASGRERRRHLVDQCLDTLRHLGLPDEPAAAPFHFPAAGLDSPRPRVALAPFSRWPAKNWPLARFAAVGQALRERRGASLYVLGGPEDAAGCGRLADALEDPVVNLCGRTGLLELGGVLGEMDLLITNDSGPMHLACAAATRVLALFGPTDPRRTGPYGVGHEVLQAPSFDPARFDPARYRRPDPGLMEEIPVDLVLTRALDLLAPASS